MLKNLSIRSKLLLISVIPLFVLAYFVTDSLVSYLDRRENSIKVSQEFEQVEKISEVVHQLQIERGMTFGYAVTKRQEFYQQLSQQRNFTDKAISDLKEFLQMHKRILNANPFLDSIPRFRNNYISYTDYLNSVKEKLLSEINNSTRFAESLEIRNQLTAHLNLMYAKENLARIRSLIEPAVLTGDLPHEQFAKFSSRLGQYQFVMERFRERADPVLNEYFAREVSGSDLERILMTIDSINRYPDHIRNIQEQYWWTTSSSAVNMLRATENYSLALIKDRVKTDLALINRAVYLNIIIGLALLVTIGLLVLFTVRQITNSIKQVKLAAEKMTNGEVDFLLDESGKDELGNLAQAFNHMISVTRQYAHVAEAIGQGDYNAYVKVRSKGDMLGKSLVAMKTNLQTLASENERRTWLLTGTSELNDSMRGDKEVMALSQDVLDALVSYLKAQYGALYVCQNSHLELSATYAAAPGQEISQLIKLGEGLVGQAAKSGKLVNLKSVPSDYIRIHSAIGTTVPKNVIIYPFHYEQEVKGVIEIASLHEFSEDDVELLKIISNNIAISIQAAQSRERLKQLLEETQGQSEELLSQQEELKLANEELQEKTEMLERSEEELRSQQEELQQTNVELQEKATLLEDQKEQVERARALLEDKARELELTNLYKTEFLANMSHELRTPLNSILILSQVLIENRSNALSPKEIQFANTIYNSGADLLSLINDILDLSKIEAGKMELDLETFPLIDVPKNLQATFSELANNKSISFKVDMENSITEMEVMSDRMRLEQILKNFLSNSFKFTEEGGAVTLKISRAGKHVHFQNSALKQSDRVLSFSVIDTGIGIAPEKLGPIFEAFQQGDGSTKRKYGGTGLGLSISRQLASLLGGEIHVESFVGKGSTFTLHLPETYEGAAEIAQPTVRLGAPAVSMRNEKRNAISQSDGEDSVADDKHQITDNDRKILILEDDEEFAKILLKLVRERHYKGIIATHGHIGLNYARYYKPDAILLDMTLPVMDGAEVLRHLKRDPDLRHIPVQIISGSDHKQETLELGAFDFIQKPVSKKDLWRALDKIEDFVDRKVKRLLIIEDDKDHSDALKELIGNGDVKCFSAFSAESALNTLRADKFDCIILDLGLPDVTGFELLEEIKKDPSISRIPVIIYTGRSLSREENARLERLASAVVVKTAFSHERLLDETTLFLHRVESRLPREKQTMIRNLHKGDEVLRNKKVLIVDDDVRNVYSLVAAFEHEGLICLSAENGKVALDILDKDREIDMVLMDVMMPEMDGYEATRALRARQEWKDLPVIGLTAKAMKGDREKCLACGMSDYVSKPVHVQRLLSLMRVWLYA